MAPVQTPRPALSDGVVTLRPFTSADAPGVATALADGDVSRWTSMIPHPYTEDHAREWIASHAARLEAGDGLDLAITEDGGQALGAIGLELRGDCPQLGYWMALAARNRGMATRALVLLSDWTLNTLGLDRVELFTMHDNVASERVAAKAGFAMVELIHDKDLGSKRATVHRWSKARPVGDAAGIEVLVGVASSPLPAPVARSRLDAWLADRSLSESLPRGWRTERIVQTDGERWLVWADEDCLGTFNDSRQEAANVLLDEMRELSHRGFAAGWMNGLEFDLWAAAHGGVDVRYGGARISAEQCDLLRRLAVAADGWWRMTDEGATFVTLDRWRQFL